MSKAVVDKVEPAMAAIEQAPVQESVVAVASPSPKNLPKIENKYCSNFFEMLNYLHQYKIAYNEAVAGSELSLLTLFDLVLLFHNNICEPSISSEDSLETQAFSRFSLVNHHCLKSAKDYIKSYEKVESMSPRFFHSRHFICPDYANDSREFEEELVKLNIMPTLFIKVANSIKRFVAAEPPSLSNYNSYCTFEIYAWHSWIGDNMLYLDHVKAHAEALAEAVQVRSKQKTAQTTAASLAKAYNPENLDKGARLHRAWINTPDAAESKARY